MVDRYQGRRFPAHDDYDRGGDPHASAHGESDPLAELARLIGQTDPFGGMDRANHPDQPRPSPRDQYPRDHYDQYQPPAAPDDEGPPTGPPPWIQRAQRQDLPPQEPSPDYSDAVQPMQRYAGERAAADADYRAEAPFSDAGSEPDPSRYDEALYGQLDAGDQDYQQDPAYADDAYAYQDEYEYDDNAEGHVRKRGGGMVTVAVVLALAVVGTGAAFAYRTYFNSPSNGEPPIIRADNTPTKIVPAPPDGNPKVPDRMVGGDGAEKIVPREEAPVDVNVRSGAPRVVFPPLNQNAVSLPPPSVASAGPQPAPTGNGTLANNEPRKIKTLTVRGDQPDSAAVPVMPGAATAAKQAPPARTAAALPPTAPRSSPSSANASDNAPLSLAPQAAQPTATEGEPRSRVASANPVQPDAPAGSGGYLVQVSSQKNEADAQASYRALQGKFPAVLGSRAPVIKRADLGNKGVYYRAMVGPFGTSEEASQFCGSLKSAGGQCIVQRN